MKLLVDAGEYEAPTLLALLVEVVKHRFWQHRFWHWRRGDGWRD